MLKIYLTLFIVSLAAVIDLRIRRIPNVLTMPAIAFGIILNTYNSGLGGGVNALAGFTSGILVLLIPFILGGMGAGDVKLLAAIGALNGTQFVLQASLYSALSGGVIALIVAAARGQLGLVTFNTYMAVQSFSIYKILKKDFEPTGFLSSNIRFPYGMAILAGTIITYLMGWAL
ncbi:MAG TPA: A24 family peptidase [Desulfobacteria bacterium]|nr:A24 family peptidase [Desulfobacteria bacterium]